MSDNQMPVEEQLKKAKILSEALPYMHQFSGQTFVIKYGGHAMGDKSLAQDFARDVALLKQVGINPIIVHGGGPQIGEMLNKNIVMEINEAGGLAVGLSGKDGKLIEVQKLNRTKRDPDSNIERILDLGFVGEPSRINPEILQSFEEIDVIPVIAPIGVGPNGQTFNINADTAAGHIAAAIGASKLIMMTDVEGVLDKQKKLINRLTPTAVEKLQKDGTIVGGMIPKLETCLFALENGVDAAHILDGRIPHVLLLETFTEHGIGTMIHHPGD